MKSNYACTVTYLLSIKKMLFTFLFTTKSHWAFILGLITKGAFHVQSKAAHVFWALNHLCECVFTTVPLILCVASVSLETNNRLKVWEPMREQLCSEAGEVWDVPCTSAAASTVISCTTTPSGWRALSWCCWWAGGAWHLYYYYFWLCCLRLTVGGLQGLRGDSHQGGVRLAHLELRQSLSHSCWFGQDELRCWPASHYLDRSRSAGCRLTGGLLRQLCGQMFGLDELRELACRIGLQEWGELVGRDGDDGDLLSCFGAGG